jgi:hypothetical protein
MINVAQGIHLELWLGWAGLGLRVQRRGAALRGRHHRRARVPMHRGPTIQDGLSLSLSPLAKNENLLQTIGYFWSDALNCFLFDHGVMTPTLLDVVMITGLNISSSCPSAYRLSEVPFKLSSTIECTNWGAYLNQHLKTKGPVTEMNIQPS